ncbi:MAG: NAD+ synthase [Deltaproteobacteria bacterium]|jgi:NAD+ synthetase|nr:NAD+ synthase [Deltaproteobacteria bacterium]
MKCALVQLNPKVGDIINNRKNILKAMQKAKDLSAQLLLFPEMAITGYPPRDLLLYPAFVERAKGSAELIAKAAGEMGLTVLIGSIGYNLEKGQRLYNRALLMEGGDIIATYAKRLLPTYDVFDEARYFEAGTGPLVFKMGGLNFAVTICEDIWNDEAFWPHPLYRLDPLAGHPPFDVLLNLSASPFSVGKELLRERMLKALAQKYSCQILYCNQVGANDELIFDGRSSFFAPDGTLMARAKSFQEDILVVDLENPTKEIKDCDFDPEPETWEALSLGIRDYCSKNGLKSVVLGLSGGIDSALSASLAVNAMGKENVQGLIMPSPHSSDHSVFDALELASNLSLELVNKLPIGTAMESFKEILAPVFIDLPPNEAEENIQARIRGVLLMAVANKFGRVLLTTGNKSEISVGYCTIYGDMCGALAVIGDLYKTEVYSLANWVNREKIIIPRNTILKPPSAELKPGQTDQDNLPPYELLDAILIALLEKRISPMELARTGRFETETVRKVSSLVRAAEFKRRQGAPVLKITSQAFGVGWRMPIACRSIMDEFQDYGS